MYMAQYGVVVFTLELGHLHFLSEVIAILIFTDDFKEVSIHNSKHFNNHQSIQ